MDLGQGFIATRSLRSGRAHLVATTLATALSGLTIGGCAPTFAVDDSRNFARPIPQVNTISMNSALLRRQPEPDCAFRGPLSDPITAEETRQKLDYEQQCYRQAEIIVRARLEQLQGSVREMIKVARQPQS
jgi:hypothetical protein